MTTEPKRPEYSDYLGDQLELELVETHHDSKIDHLIEDYEELEKKMDLILEKIKNRKEKQKTN